MMEVEGSLLNSRDKWDAFFEMVTESPIETWEANQILLKSQDPLRDKEVAIKLRIVGYSPERVYEIICALNAK